MTDESASGPVAIEQREHHSDASAKKVLLRGQDPDTGNFVNLAVGDLGDGTYGLRGTGLIPYRFTQIQFSNPNGNSPPNYQTGVVKNGSTTLGTLDLSYDGNGTLTNVTFTAS